MPTDPLVAALAGGNEGAAANPFLLQAAPELQTAQQLQQAGMSTSPATAAQAWGRLAQALAGTVMRHEATSDLAKAISGTSSKMAQLFPEGSIMRTGLSSPDPLVQAMMWQQIPKTVPLLSQAEKLGPNEVVRGIPANAPAGQPLAAGSPALAGATAEAQEKAKAPYLPGGPATEQTPYGPREIELTAAERAVAAQRRAGGTPMPSAAIPQPQAQAPQQAPQAQAQQAQVPQAPPVGAVMGKPIAHPEFEPLIRTNSDEVDKTRAVADKAQQTNGTAKLVLDLLPKVQTGWTTETKLQAENILKGLGIDPAGISAFNKIDLASGQVLSKKFLDLSMGAMRSDFGGSREAFGAMQMFRNAYPSIGTDPDAVRLQTHVLRMDNLRGANLANAKTSYLQNSINDIQNTGKYRGLNGFNEQFAKTDGPELYVHAAEAMSGPRFAQWDKIKSTAERNAIVRLIPSGEQFYAPDREGKMKWFIKPGGAAVQ
jgi:hypothetical protein